LVWQFLILKQVQDDYATIVFMNKNLIIVPIACLMLFGAGCEQLSLNKTATVPTSTVQVQPAAPDAIPKQITIFVSNTCPHCAYVESQISGGQVDKALPIVYKEVSNDANMQAFVQTAQTCKLDMSLLGVPLLWNGTICYSGQDDIMTYIGQLMKIYEKNRSAN